MAPVPAPARASYEELYEGIARNEAEFGDHGVGSGDFATIGEIELDILRSQGLEPSSTLVDFGCGNGRLAIHAVPFLVQGTYIGIDIAPSFLEQAGRRLEGLPTGFCSVRFIHQNNETFALADHSVDMICAFSVFTHMEHEDLYRYLVQMKRVVRRGGTAIISVLPLDLDVARTVFLGEAALDPAARWQRVRNVTTSVDLVDQIARLAGWTVRGWLPGSAGQAMSAAGELRGLGQSVVILTS
ncbi:MAG TPA: class I SAM-dependent methyltransferase [Ilumatobacteraceae bacterium]